jgi:hypothetical protein
MVMFRKLKEEMQKKHDREINEIQTKFDEFSKKRDLELN